uniref:PAS domain-containing protein n=1 Tax=Angiostrongylus cantonensis TaxID=6313 RepID=A0A158PB32_ANGCA
MEFTICVHPKKQNIRKLNSGVGSKKIPEQAQPIFAAYCQPVINPENAEALSVGNTDVFSSQHYLDMTFKEVDHMYASHFGYSKDELKGQSWYSLLHPTHLPEIAYKHRLLCQEKEGSVLALIKMQSANGEWKWLHTVFAIRGSLCHEVQEGRRVRHLIHCYYQILSSVEAATLQANSWIYNIRHTYPTAFPCQESPTPDRPLSPVSPFPVDPVFSQPFDHLVPFIKQKQFSQMTMIPYGMTCGQIKVEIPMKTMPHLSMFTPENSSPESSGSLTSALLSQPFFSAPPVNDVTMEDFNCIMPLTIKGTLPDLRDGLDDFFREVEQPTEPTSTPTADSVTAVQPSPEQAAELFKYLGPALFGPAMQPTGQCTVPNEAHSVVKRRS